jgi:hypothetical protein
MRHLELVLPANLKDSDVLRAIDRAIRACGLQTGLRGSLQKHPGCTHWHTKLPRQRGTLEITYWPLQRRAWFTIQAGRNAPWIKDMIPTLAAAIQRE